MRRLGWAAGMYQQWAIGWRPHFHSLRCALASTMMVALILLLVLVAREGCHCHFDDTVLWRYSPEEGARARLILQAEMRIGAHVHAHAATAANRRSPPPPYVPHSNGAVESLPSEAPPHQRELVALSQGRRRKRRTGYVEAGGAGPVARGLRAAPLDGHLGGAFQSDDALGRVERNQLMRQPAPSVDLGPHIRHFPNFAFHYLRVYGADCSNLRQPGGAPAEFTRIVAVSSSDSNATNTSDAGSEPFAMDYVVTYVHPSNVPPLHVSPQRVRDWNELYWNLRSMFYNGRLCVFKGQPDRCLLGRIHLVVASRAHVPTWLSRRLVRPDANGTAKLELRFREFLRERLNVVEHKDMFPPGTPYSEAYNSNVIELNLHRIPGLSPFYLYFNNDMFLGRELRLQDLFTPSSLSAAPPSQPFNQTNGSAPVYCDLLPITWYESEPYVRLIYPIPDAGGRFPLGQQAPARLERPGMSEIESMMVFNENLLSSPAFASPFLQHRFDAGDVGRPPLLRYPHVPMLYDRRTLEWVFNHAHFAPAVADTMRRSQVRGTHDLWVPYLYSNVRRLAFYGAQSLMDRLFSTVTPGAHRFSMLTDMGSIRSETMWVLRNPKSYMLFVTLNDDFPSHIPPNVASPSQILFNDSDNELGEVVCNPHRVEDAESRALRGLSMYSVSRVAFRYLFNLHRMYCVWEGYWAGAAS